MSKIHDMLTQGTPTQQFDTAISDSPKKSLSSAQTRLWLLNELNNCAYIYHVPVILSLAPNHSTDHLKNAIKYFVQNHPVLSSCFHKDSTGVHQLRGAIDDFEFGWICCEQDLPSFVQIEAGHPLESFFLQSFDLNKTPLFRIAFLETPQQQFLLMCFHHIIMDGWSIQLIIQRINQYYALINRHETTLLKNPEEHSYFDFIEWEYTESYRSKAHMAFWLNRLQNETLTVDLVTDYPRKSRLSGSGKTVRFRVADSIFSQLKALGREEACSINQLILFAFQFMLSQYSGQENITVGLPVAGRTQSRWYQTIGLFVNTFLHSISIQHELTIADHLMLAKKKLLEDVSYATVPFDEVVKELYVHKRLNPNRSFNVLYNFIQSLGEQNDEQAIAIQPTHYYAALPVSKFDVSLHVYANKTDLDLFFEYSTDLYIEKTIQNMALYVLKILEIMPLYTKEPVSSMIWQLNNARVCLD